MVCIRYGIGFNYHKTYPMSLLALINASPIHWTRLLLGGEVEVAICFSSRFRDFARAWLRFYAA